MLCELFELKSALGRIPSTTQNMDMACMSYQLNKEG